MKQKTNRPADLVVEETRKARQRLWKQAGGTFEGLSRLVKEIASEKPSGRNGNSKRTPKLVDSSKAKPRR